MGEFLRRHQELLVARVIYWHGAGERAGGRARAAQLPLRRRDLRPGDPANLTRRALADLSILLAMWAASDHGVGEMYGPAPVRPVRRA